MLKMKIQLFAEDEDKQNVPFKAFATEEELNEFVGKQLQSASSKAKGEILSELGIKSVNEAKEKFGALSELDGLKTQYTETKTKYEELENKYNEVLQQHSKAKETLIMKQHNVPEEFQEYFMTLAKSKVKEDVTLEQAAEEVSSVFNFSGGSNVIKIGGDPNKAHEDITDINEKLRKI